MLTPFKKLRGCTLSASDGEIGKVHEFYFDDEHWMVRYLVVNCGSWFTGRQVLIAPQALADVDLQSRSIDVNLTCQQVSESPLAETDKPISRQQAEALHGHYGWARYWTVSGGGMMLPAPTSPQPADAAEDSPEEQDGHSHLRSSAELMSGYTVHSQDGEIGRVTDFVLDNETWEVRYFVIHTGAWFLGKDALISSRWVEKISYEGAEIFVNLPRSVIRHAPAYDSNAPLSRAFEQRLHAHYNLDGYWDAVRAAGKV